MTTRIRAIDLPPIAVILTFLAAVGYTTKNPPPQAIDLLVQTNACSTPMGPFDTSTACPVPQAWVSAVYDDGRFVMARTDQAGRIILPGTTATLIVSADGYQGTRYPLAVGNVRILLEPAK